MIWILITLYLRDPLQDYGQLCAFKQFRNILPIQWIFSALFCLNPRHANSWVHLMNVHEPFKIQTDHLKHFVHPLSIYTLMAGFDFVPRHKRSRRPEAVRQESKARHSEQRYQEVPAFSSARRCMTVGAWKLRAVMKSLQELRFEQLWNTQFYHARPRGNNANCEHGNWWPSLGAKNSCLEPVYSVRYQSMHTRRLFVATEVWCHGWKKRNVPSLDCTLRRKSWNFLPNVR